MKYAIFADIHSNLEAYETILNAIKKEKVLKYFCVGDIVGYGADPAQCIEITRNLNCVTVCGNHDWAVADLVNTESFNPYAKAAVLWTKEVINKKDTEYLRKLGLTYEDNELTLVHGTLSNPEEFNYVLDTYTAYKMMETMRTQIGFIGHSHIAGIFVLGKNEPEYRVNSKIKIEPNKKYLVNVGSIGQPRDRDWRAAFCIYDKNNQTLEIKRIRYNVKKAQKKILDANLPKTLASRLSEGR